MKAVVLAAGNGVRLRPVTETRPKPLIPVLCKPVLGWHLEWLSRLNIDEVVLVVNYMKEMIMEYVSRFHRGLRVRYVVQDPPLGTGDAVVKALDHLPYGEDVLIVYSDVFMKDASVYRELASIKEPVILGAVVDKPEHYGVLELENGRLKRIVEKPPQPPSPIANAGVYKLNTKDIDEHKNVGVSVRGEVEFTDIVSNIARVKQVNVYTLPKGWWIDIGRPWHILEANKMALEDLKRSIKGVVEEPVRITGEVYVGEGSTVHSFSSLEGPVYIDSNVEVGPNARVRPFSVICSGSKVGFSVEVKESVLFENVRASHLAYIGDSVVCENVNLGAGTITANLRFDEKPVKMMVKDRLEDTGRVKLGAVIGGYVKTGVNVSIMPGVKIGSYSWILPGAVVHRDVPSKTTYPEQPRRL
ncbi:NTP transferase domain-containing protein [Thermosphaera chiliense]|uniref:NTP transferase domain-containing protein n=1 Tax=Thermosphaera chiliense TaxID=3402707 RepID=A0A7M1USR6_9CREN|nr:bifunctional sugar-1-phosphate nucleotidylyltransferase/acetyltransferase [Thermosphaera aggregans]QOR95059.1 NTP transferase domain-containing protein [Thermosphaera aggregans]